MQRARFIVLLAGTAVIAGVLACPPYMVIDAAVPIRHAALGHHPRWQPPSLAMAEQALEARFGPPPGAPSASRVAVNGVRLGFETAAVIIGMASVWAFRPRRRAGREGDPS